MAYASKILISARYPYRCSSSPLSSFASRIFHAHAKKTHAENVCTRTRSTRLPRWRFLAPLCPSFSLSLRSPSCLTPSHLSSSITPSPLLSYSLFFSLTRTRAGVAFFLSLLSRNDTPLFPSVTPASSLRLFTQDEIVKSVLRYSTRIFNMDLRAQLQDHFYIVVLY